MMDDDSTSIDSSSIPPLTRHERFMPNLPVVPMHLFSFNMSQHEGRTRGTNEPNLSNHRMRSYVSLEQAISFMACQEMRWDWDGRNSESEDLYQVAASNTNVCEVVNAMRAIGKSDQEIKKSCICTAYLMFDRFTQNDNARTSCWMLYLLIKTGNIEGNRSIPLAIGTNGDDNYFSALLRLYHLEALSLANGFDCYVGESEELNYVGVSIDLYSNWANSVEIWSDDFLMSRVSNAQAGIWLTPHSDVDPENSIPSLNYETN